MRRWQAAFKIEVVHCFNKVGSHTAKQNGDALRLHIVDKMPQNFHAYHVGIARSLDTQDDNFQLILRSLAEFIEVALQFGSKRRRRTRLRGP